jgi:magnesium-transporting ATPase (P-type)
VEEPIPADALLLNLDDFLIEAAMLDTRIYLVDRARSPRRRRGQQLP